MKRSWGRGMKEDKQGFQLRLSEKRCLGRWVGYEGKRRRRKKRIEDKKSTI